MQETQARSSLDKVSKSCQPTTCLVRDRILLGCAPDWDVDLIDTGSNTMTGGRIKGLQPFLGHSTFMLTLGEGVCDVDLNALLDFHRFHGQRRQATREIPAS